MPHSSILFNTAALLHINLGSAAENERLLVYKETVEAMIDALYATSLNVFRRAAIEMLERDIREMIAGLRRVNRSGIPQIRSYLEKAQIEATLALNMFDYGEEEMAITRLEKRFEALLECRTNLENAKDFLLPLVNT